MTYHYTDDTNTHALCNPLLRFTPPPGFVMEEYVAPEVGPDEMCAKCAQVASAE